MPFIHVEFINQTDGYLAISFTNSMCPGDVVVLSYDRTPKVIDGFCRYNLRDTKPDYVFGGKNNWEIVKSEKHKGGHGWAIEAKRALETGDGPKLDK
jgi:hypothetical protein